EGFIRTALEKCHLEDPNSHAPIIRELMNEVEQNYVLSMKLHTVKRELMIAYSTEDAELDEENQFASVMVVFLPKQIPWSALVHHHTADLRVFEVVAEMVQMPILAASTFEMTSLVWRRYGLEVKKLELADTTRVGGVDVKRIRRPQSMQKADKIFEPKELKEHMAEHREK
ncbi:unnamed protein product, partial [Polarella glacialis]